MKKIKRSKPGTKGGGNYFRIILRPSNQFATFRYHDVGEPGHALRLAGKRTTGSWDTQAWLINKEDAHVENKVLIPDTKDAKKIIESLGTQPVRVRSDIFFAKDRRNIPEDMKPTVAQSNARKSNIEKAHQRRWN